jgi:hypothetical protein
MEANISTKSTDFFFYLWTLLGYPWSLFLKSGPSLRDMFPEFFLGTPTFEVRNSSKDSTLLYNGFADICE